MKAIIFGVSGQDGYYLSKLLCEKKYSVIGVSRKKGDWISGNVAEYSFVENLIKAEMPDIIFHLAANSTTRHDALFENHETISTGSLNILEAIYRHNPKCKVFLSGSAMQFKNTGTAIDENTPFEASSPYSIARIQSTYAARYYRSKGLKVYVGYFFNHESPLRAPNHISKYIINSVNKIKNGLEFKIELGNIDVRKEWNFAGDFANAMDIIVNQDNFFEVVIGGGEVHTIKEWLEASFKHIGKNWEDYVVLKDNFTPEYNLLVSNPALLFSLGYKPKVNFQSLNTLMLS